MAARQKGSFSLGGTLEIKADAPADARLCVKTKSELTDANSYPYKYVGMIVSVADEGKAYILTGTDTTVASNWKELGEGGGGAEAFIVTITMDGGNLVADKTPKELEDAIAANAIAKAKLPMYGLTLDLSVSSENNFAFSTFYTEDAADISTTAFGTILMVKDTDSAWDSITMQTLQGDAFSKEVKCGADLLEQSAIYLNDFDHEEDTVNDEDVITPHRLTAGELAEICSTLPGATTNYPKYSTTEQVIGEWINGKPIYQKTINNVSTGSGTWTGHGSFATDVDEVINYWGIMKGSSSNQTKSGMSFGGTHNEYFDIWTDGGRYYSCYDSTHQNRPFVFTVQYTKTTD